MLSSQIKRPDPLAIVITRMHRGGRLPEFPWLDERCAIDGSNWIVLTPQGWQALAAGEESLWEAMERKLLLSCYLHQPELIAVVGHPDGQEDEGAGDAGRQEVHEVVRRVHDCNLPVEVLGFWGNAADDDGELIAPSPMERAMQYAMCY